MPGTISLYDLGALYSAPSKTGERREEGLALQSPGSAFTEQPGVKGPRAHGSLRKEARAPSLRCNRGNFSSVRFGSWFQFDSVECIARCYAKFGIKPIGRCFENAQVRAFYFFVGFFVKTKGAICRVVCVPPSPAKSFKHLYCRPSEQL